MLNSQSARKKAKTTDAPGSSASQELGTRSGTFWSSLGQGHLLEIDNIISSKGNGARMYDQLSLEVEELQRILKATIARRSACAPVFRLPPEIISYIFKFIALGSPPGFKDYVSRHTFNPADPVDPDTGFNTAYISIWDLGWIPTITHVCKRWRDIALETSSLWAEVICSIPHAQEEFLNRARCAPLALCMHDFYDHLPRHKFIIEHLSRAREVNVAYMDTETHLQDFKNALASTPMPVLEAISYKGDSMQKASSYDLPSMVAPRLQRVTLREAFIPWNADTITELDLHRDYNPRLPSYNGDAGLPTFPQLIGLLHRSQNLRRLRLSHWIPDPSSQPSSVAKLPHLSYISLTSRPERCRAIFEYLCPSPFAQIDLELEYGGGSEILNPSTEAHIEESFRLLKVLPSKIHFADAQNPLPPVAVLIDAEFEQADVLQLQLFAPANGLDDKMSSVEPGPFRVGYKLAHRIPLPKFSDGEAYVRLLQCLVDNFGLKNVEKLVVWDVYRGWDVATWRSILFRYPKIRALYLSVQNRNEGFNAALRTSPEESLHAPFLPELNLLSFEEMHDGISHDDPTGQEGWLPDILEDLALTLETRAAMGRPLSRIEFEEFMDQFGNTYFSPNPATLGPSAVWSTFKNRTEAVLTDGLY